MATKQKSEKSENELIDEFYVNHGGKPCLSADLSFYESSWDVLMPVVEKIQSLDYIEKHSDDYFRFGSNSESKLYWCEFGRFRFTSTDSLIEAFYTVVSEFIKWHNSTLTLAIEG